LNTLLQAASQIRNERLRVIGVTLADDEGRNQLRVSIQRNERPNVAVCANPVSNAALGPDESPNFVVGESVLGRKGGTAKICVSVTETILQNALKKWQCTRSRLADHLLRGFVAKRQRYEYNT
jgi:hypothetical protein